MSEPTPIERVLLKRALAAESRISTLLREREELREALRDDAGMTSWANAVIRNFERDNDLGVNDQPTPGDWYRHAAAKLADKWLARSALSTTDTRE